MRRSTLHCALLSAVFISAIFTLSRFLNHDSARAAILKPSTQTQGSLQVVADKGKPVGNCPLKHTAVKAQVSGFISRVTVTQEFENPLTESIDDAVLTHRTERGGSFTLILQPPQRVSPEDVMPKDWYSFLIPRAQWPTSQSRKRRRQ